MAIRDLGIDCPDERETRKSSRIIRRLARFAEVTNQARIKGYQQTGCVCASRTQCSNSSLQRIPGYTQCVRWNLPVSRNEWTRLSCITTTHKLRPRSLVVGSSVSTPHAILLAAHACIFSERNQSPQRPQFPRNIAATRHMQDIWNNTIYELAISLWGETPKPRGAPCS